VSTTAALALTLVAAVAGTVTVARVVSWSFSAARRHRITVRVEAKAARHRAEKRRRVSA